MTQQDETRKALARRPAPTGYEIGYGKPPVHSRFPPGQSGNPGGRRKGSKNKPAIPAPYEEKLKEIVLEEAYRTVSVTDSNGQLKIPLIQAVVRSMAVKAVRGDDRAQRRFTDLVAVTERENNRVYVEMAKAAIDYKLDCERELERRKSLGITGPQPFPNPDDIVIDRVTGELQIRGPVTKEEAAWWNQMRAQRQQCVEEIRDMEEELKTELDDDYRETVRGALRDTRRMKAFIDNNTFGRFVDDEVAPQ